MQILRDMGLDVAETDFTLEDALGSEEGFYTGSTARIVPIKTIDGQPLAGKCPGPVTVRIREALNDAYAGRTPKYEHWLAYVNPPDGA